MNKKILLLLPVICLLSACDASNKKKDYTDDYVPEQITYYAFFMNNYPRVTGISVSGNEERLENNLYQRIEIQPGVPFAKPKVDPERENYEFQGWFKEKGGVNEWNFSTDSSESSVFLYAKWNLIKSEEYMEPEYVFPEKIITDADFRLNGVFNTPIEDGKVGLTTGMINRLRENSADVKFAISYERRESVTFTATYDAENKTIHVKDSVEGVYDIVVEDISETLVVDNSTYEQKAQGYEEVGTNYENYHIALAGSSSMENWSTSSLDMMPIVTFNHGIGGTTVDQWRDSLMQRLVLPYLPKAVAYYVGVNNIINGDQETGEATGEKLVELFDKTHQYLPDTQIFYVLINRLPGFANKQSDFDVCNGYALNYAKEHDYLTCIDAGKGLLKPDGTPNSSYFLTDGLHMSKFGYTIWGEAVKQAIIAWLDKEQ